MIPPRRRTAAAAALVCAALPLASPSTSSATTAAGTPAAAAPAVAPAAVPAAVVTAVSPTDRRIYTKLQARIGDRHLGSNTAGFVADVASGKIIWGHRSRVGLLPASTMKLATATVALRTMGPNARLTTRVADAGGGRIVLVGAGDPALSSSQLGALAAATARSLRARHVSRVSLVVDDSRFPRPTRAIGWPTGYYPHEVAPVRALIVDQHEVMDTALDAGRVLSTALEARGVTVTVVRRGVRPAGSRTVAFVQSPPLSRLVATMLYRSDNDYAEALLKLAALRSGKPATWAGATANARRVLAGLGVTLDGAVLRDGSGLSRSDRLAPHTLADIVRLSRSSRHPELAPIWAPDAMATAGVSGSLRSSRGRFATYPTKCATGRVRGKVGGLHDVVSLAGTARGADGRLKAFSFVENGRPSDLATKQAIDRLATTVTGCW